MPSPKPAGTQLGPLNGSQESLQLVREATASLEERLHQLAEHGLLGDTQHLNARIRAASARMALQIQNRGKSASKEVKVAFLLALSSGLSVQGAAALVGIPEMTLRRERNRDADFEREWELALEARSEPLEERLYDIASKGEGMPAVRAAQILLAASNRRHRKTERITTTSEEDGKQRTIVWDRDDLTPD